MKTIGMIGGMSWESTASYYRAINEGIKRELGGLHSAKICLISVDFDEIEQLQREGDWTRAGELLASVAVNVQAGGADFLLICTNTMHKVADAIQSGIGIPLLHIADATAQQLIDDKIDRVGLLGTRFTMEDTFYKARLTDKFGIEVLVPSPANCARVSDIIYEELCLGAINAESRAFYVQQIAELAERGAQAVILGCTEIALLVQQPHTEIPLYDTTSIHAEAAVKMALTDR